MLLAPNVPHCYFKGEVIEIMHSSNNVIRLGLTKKFKDKKNLLKLVDYQHDYLAILNSGLCNGKGEQLTSTDLNKFFVNYPTKFDHLFRVKIILRDGRSQKNPDHDYLSFVKNKMDYFELSQNGNEICSQIGPFDKDTIILNLGSPVQFSKSIENSKCTGNEEVNIVFY